MWQRGLSQQAPNTVTSLHQSYTGTGLREVTNSITGSPSAPAFSGSPFHAPRLSKALELMPDKGKTIKKKKKAKEQGEPLSATRSA